MTKEQVMDRARTTHKKVLSDKTNPNTKIIKARRGNTSEEFKPDNMIARVDNAEKRLDYAQEALNQLGTSS